MNMGIELKYTEFGLIFTKSKSSFLKDWVMFFLYSFVSFIGIAFILYYSSIFYFLHQYILLGIIFIFIFYLFNKKNLGINLFRIQKLSEQEYKLNDNIVFKIVDGLSFVKYEYAGELFLNVSGNLFMKVQNKEFRLCNGITDAEFEFIIENLKMLFCISSIEIEYKRVL